MTFDKKHEEEIVEFDDDEDVDQNYKPAADDSS